MKLTLIEIVNASNALSEIKSSTPLTYDSTYIIKSLIKRLNEEAKILHEIQSEQEDKSIQVEVEVDITPISKTIFGDKEIKPIPIMIKNELGEIKNTTCSPLDFLDKFIAA